MDAKLQNDGQCHADSEATAQEQAVRELLDRIPIELTPQFRMQVANMPIEIFKEEMSLEANGKSYFAGAGEITYEWLPSPGYRFRIHRQFEKPDSLDEYFFGDVDSGIPEEVRLVLKKSHRIIVPLLIHRAASLEEGTRSEIRGAIVDDPIPEGLLAYEAVFHLPNFQADIGKRVRSATDKPTIRYARHEMEVDGWRITLDSLSDLSEQNDLKEELNSRGGYAIIHVGSLKRCDNLPFLASNGAEFLGKLFWFFSFCRGFKTGPILVNFFKADSHQCHLNLRDSIVHNWTNRSIWMDECRMGTLAEILPGYIQRINDPKWTSTVEIAIHWYLEVLDEAGGTEGSIVFAQTAMEMLGWTLLVDELGILSQGGFNDLPAADKMRLLLTTCKIPIQIPDSLPHLSATAKAENWKDGPDAISGIRNAVIHSNAKKRGILDRIESHSTADVVWLSEWYLELLLLWTFGYRGKYFNRVGSAKYMRGNIVPVPWAEA